ncbi:uncharacterized protein LOC134279807 [Saccostrea cucullata]|uniref:uncharacterized protein LOC134279807 n=1 Tax=Saccostrea cuccullata TaxID=36930 RepID=UPI002ED3CB36
MGNITFPNIKEERRKVQPLKEKHSTSYLKPTLSLSSSVTEVREFTVPDVDDIFHMSLDQSGRLWDGDLIFTDIDKKVINRTTLDNNITEFIETRHWIPFCIHSSHTNGNILVGLVTSGEAKVTRYNKTGKELQNIQRDNKGQGLYSRPIYITENINGNICTSDYDKKAVVVVNKVRKHRFSYTGQESKFRPHGICTDVLGHILVCDLQNIHLLDKDGQFLSLLITPKQVSHPVSVCG